MKFEKHVFISYAHIDNMPLLPEQQGWVSMFHMVLPDVRNTFQVARHAGYADHENPGYRSTWQQAVAWTGYGAAFRQIA